MTTERKNSAPPPVVLTAEALEISGYRSPVSLWNLERKGLFPQRRKLGPNRVGWLRHEVEAWLESRAKGINAPTKPA